MGDVFDAIGDVIGSVFDAVKSVVSSIAEIGKSLFSSPLGGFLGSLAMSFVLPGLGGWLAQSATPWVSSLGQGMIAVTEAMSLPGKILGKAAGSLLGSVGTALGENAFGGIFTSISDSLNTLIGSTSDELFGDFFSGAINDFSSNISKAFTGLDFGGEMVNGVELPGLSEITADGASLIGADGSIQSASLFGNDMAGGIMDMGMGDLLGGTGIEKLTGIMSPESAIAPDGRIELGHAAAKPDINLDKYESLLGGDLTLEQNIMDMSELSLPEPGAVTSGVGQASKTPIQAGQSMPDAASGQVTAAAPTQTFDTQELTRYFDNTTGTGIGNATPAAPLDSTNSLTDGMSAREMLKEQTMGFLDEAGAGDITTIDPGIVEYDLGSPIQPYDGSGEAIAGLDYGSQQHQELLAQQYEFSDFDRVTGEVTDMGYDEDLAFGSREQYEAGYLGPETTEALMNSSAVGTGSGLSKETVDKLKKAVKSLFSDAEVPDYADLLRRLPKMPTAGYQSLQSAATGQAGRGSTGGEIYGLQGLAQPKAYSAYASRMRGLYS